MKTLTNEDLINNARMAFNQNRLTAQAPNPSDRKCVYRQMCIDNIERCCAIGASIDNDVNLQNVNYFRVLDLIASKLINFEDVKFASKFQSTHDRWCHAASTQHRDTELFKQNFVDMIS